MAVHAQWQTQYGLSFRQGPLDLSKKLDAASTTLTDRDAASHDNDGLQGNVTVSTKEYGGDQHFNGASMLIADQGIGVVQGQGQTSDSTNITYIYGQPVVGNPSFSPGQSILDFRKTNGDAIGRIGGTDDATGNADAYRGGQSPTFSAETIPTSKSLTSILGGFFQHGLKEDSTTDNIKVARFPKASDGSDPKWIGSWMRKISSGQDDSQILSDCLPTSLSLSTNTDGILTANTDWTGRILVTDVTSNVAVGGSAAANLTLDDGRNYLMQDCQALISNGDKTQHLLTELSDFNLSLSNSLALQRYNDQFPLRFVMGDYTAEGSITIPWSSGLFGAVTTQEDYFYRMLTSAGSNGTTPSAYLNPLNIKLYWQTPANQFSGASGSDQHSNIPTTVTSDRELHILMHVVVTDVQIVGDIEAEVQVSFRCLHKYNSSGALEANAVTIASRDDLSDTWGYSQASSLYTTEAA